MHPRPREPNWGPVSRLCAALVVRMQVCTPMCTDFPGRLLTSELRTPSHWYPMHSLLFLGPGHR